MILALRLASSGWWNGSPGEVLNAPADEVMLAVQYDNFKGEYEAEAIRMMKEKAA